MTVPFVHRHPSLRWNFLASVAGNTVFAFGSWLTLSFLAKTTDATAVGRYVLALALTAPVFLFANLQLREVQATDGVSELPFRSYLSARLATSGLAFLALAALAFAFDGTTRLVIVLTAASKALDAVVDVIYGDWLRQERQGRVAGSMVLRGISTVVMMGLALTLTRSVIVASWVSLAQSALGLGHAFLLRPTGGAGADHPVAPGFALPWRRLLPLVPLGLAVACDSLAVNVPRFLIQSHLGFAKVGAFGAVGTFMQLGTATVVVGLTQVGLPRLARHHAAGEAPEYGRLLLRLLGFGLALGLFGVLVAFFWGQKALVLAFGPSYAEYLGALRWMMVAAIPWYASGILACGVTASRNFRVQLPVFGAGTLVVGVAGLVLIPRFGLEGAAISIGLGFLLRAFANGYLVLSAYRRL